MSEYFSLCEFKWLENVDKFDVNLIIGNSSIDIFLKLVLNIMMNYIIYTIIID